MARTDLASTVHQQPLNAGGALGQNAFLTTGSIHIGTGGLPVPTRNFATGIGTGLLTTYGFESLGATLVATGLYEISHAPANIARVWPQFVGPSGYTAQLTPQLSPGNSASGVVRIHATRALGPGSGAVAAAYPSGPMPFNPPSGTRFDMLFWVNSQNDQGITTY